MERRREQQQRSSKEQQISEKWFSGISNSRQELITFNMSIGWDQYFCNPIGLFHPV
jgi:hypothetical protein